MSQSEDNLLNNYPNVYHSIKSSHEYVDQLTAESRSGTVAGFTTSLKTRPLLVAKFEEFIRNKMLTIYSSRLRAELDTFIWNNGRPEAQRGYNDDLVMAIAIGCWVRDTAIVENQRDLEYKKALLGSIIKSNSILDTSVPGMINRSKAHDLDIKRTEAEKVYKEQTIRNTWWFDGHAWPGHFNAYLYDLSIRKKNIKFVKLKDLSSMMLIDYLTEIDNDWKDVKIDKINDKSKIKEQLVLFAKEYNEIIPNSNLIGYLFKSLGLSSTEEILFREIEQIEDYFYGKMKENLFYD